MRTFTPATHSHMEATLLFSGENSSTAVLSGGLVNIPTRAAKFREVGNFLWELMGINQNLLN